MHTKTLKKLALALTFWCAVHMPQLRAQIFTAPLQASTTGTNPVDFEFRADGTMIAKGNLSVGSLLTGDQGAGTRMLWFPDLAAFRAGSVSGTDWDASNIGAYSVAFGFNTTASGARSTASGTYTTASGYASTASGNYNFSIGRASLTYGQSNTASGDYSLAGGVITYTTGFAATATGVGTSAIGNCSSASGAYTIAYSANSFALGTYNVGGGDPWTWVETDPLFEVGNGTSTTPSDALVVYKNGDAVVQGNLTSGGVITAQPGGDIPMYSGH